MLYGRTLLFIHSMYKSLQVLMPNSHPTLLHSPPLVATNLFCVNKFICITLGGGGFAYKLCHTLTVLLCLNSFIYYDNLQVHSGSCKWHYFILFKGLIAFHCVYVPHPLYPFIQMDKAMSWLL